MSVRQSASLPQHAFSAHQLRAEISAARQADMGELTFEQLTETEKSAATIGVSPDAWKPIAWMNEARDSTPALALALTPALTLTLPQPQAHYGELLKNNVLAGRLTQQIEAFKTVAAGN